MFNKLVQLPFSRKRVFKLVSVITNHLLGMTQAYIYKKKNKTKRCKSNTYFVKIRASL